jgi:lysozyme family protein
MRLLTWDTAKAIYKQLYWLRPHFDQVADRYPRIAEELFDTGVNMGPKRAGEFLQVALNVLNRQHSDYPDIGVDGDLGPEAVAALDGFKAKRGAAGEAVLLTAVDCLQGAKYIAIALADPSQETFVYGWLANRIGGLQ